MFANDYEIFFRHSLELMCVAGLDGKLRRVNPAFSKVLGFSEAELLETPYIELIHPDDRQRTAEEIGRLVEGNDAVLFSIRMRCMDLSYRWIEWDVPAVPRGDTVFYPTGRDVTERRHAEEAREAMFERLQKMVEAVPEAMLLVSSEGRIVQANHAAERLFGYAKPELERMDVETLMPRSLRQAHVGYRRVYSANPMPRMMGEGRELVALNKSGKEVPVEVSLTPIDTQSGPKVLVALVNIEQAKQLSQQRLQVRDYLTTQKKSADTDSKLPSICCFCKNVREGNGEWENVEHWMKRRYGVVFSGAYCLECVLKNYPEYADDFIQELKPK